MPVLPRILACAALLACAPSLAAAPKKKADSGAPVTLRFAWPESLQAQVSETQSTYVTEGQPAQSVTQRYPLKVETRGEERWLVPGPVEVTPPEYAQVFQAMPTVTISPAGEFLRVEVPQASVEAALKVMVAMSDSRVSPEQEAQVRQQLQTAMAETIRKKWETQVGQWRGMTLRPGRAEKRKTPLKSGMLGGAPLEAEERTTLESGVPCGPDAAERRCVRLRRELVANPKDVARRIKEYEASMNTSVPETRTRVKKLELRATLELLTDPDTLVPYRLQEETVDRMDLTIGKQSVINQGMRSVNEYVFTYAK